MSATVSLTPADRLTRIIAVLFRAVADQGLGRGLRGPLILLICQRVRHLARRFAAVIANPPVPRHRASRAAAPATSPTNPRPPSPLPRHFAWLLRLLPGPAVSTARWEMLTLLDDPEMAAVIAAVPAAGRALRPLCHLLGIRPPALLRVAKRPKPPKDGPAPVPAIAAPSAPTPPPVSPPESPRPRRRAISFASPPPLFRT